MEGYAVRRTLPPSAEIQAEIDRLLGKGLVDDPQKMLGDLARLGARGAAIALCGACTVTISLCLGDCCLSSWRLCASEQP
jgi:hypothetical protein